MAGIDAARHMPRVDYRLTPSTSSRMMGDMKTKMTKANVMKMVGCRVSYRGDDLLIEKTEHMGAGGWMLKLSSGAILRPEELK